MLDYVRLAPDMDTDPALEAAGWAAARVFELLLKVSGLKDLHGRIPPELQSPRWLARRWNLDPDDLPGIDIEAFIAGGIERLIKAKLLLREPGGVLVIASWEKYYPTPKSGAQRTAEWRERKATRDACNACDEQPSPVSQPVTCDATPHHPTPPNTTTQRPPPPPTMSREAEPPDGRAVVVADELWDAFQEARVAVGRLAEAERPPRFADWAAAVWAELERDQLPRLVCAFERYLADDHFRARGWPTAVFMSRKVWASRMPRVLP